MSRRLKEAHDLFKDLQRINAAFKDVYEQAWWTGNFAEYFRYDDTLRKLRDDAVEVGTQLSIIHASEVGDEHCDVTCLRKLQAIALRATRISDEIERSHMYVYFNNFRMRFTHGVYVLWDDGDDGLGAGTIVSDSVPFTLKVIMENGSYEFVEGIMYASAVPVDVLLGREMMFRDRRHANALYRIVRAVPFTVTLQRMGYADTEVGMDDFLKSYPALLIDGKLTNLPDFIDILQSQE